MVVTAKVGIHPAGEAERQLRSQRMSLGDAQARIQALLAGEKAQAAAMKQRDKDAEALQVLPGCIGIAHMLYTPHHLSKHPCECLLVHKGAKVTESSNIYMAAWVSSRTERHAQFCQAYR